MVKRAPQPQLMAQDNHEQGPSLHHMAGEALLRIRGLTPEEQSQAGAYVLNQACQRGDEKTRDLAERALQVMEKFPNFPRPRAAVVMRALESIANRPIVE